MKITVFASNHPRHLHISKPISIIAGDVYAIEECNTVFQKRKMITSNLFQVYLKIKEKSMGLAKVRIFLDKLAEEYINSS